MNTPFWEGLPEDIRAELAAIIAEVNEQVNAIASGINDEARRTLVEDNGKTITVLSAEEITAWQDVMKPVWTQFEAEIGADMIATALGSNAG